MKPEQISGLSSTDSLAARSWGKTGISAGGHSLGDSRQDRYWHQARLIKALLIFGHPQRVSVKAGGRSARGEANLKFEMKLQPQEKV